MSRLKRLALSFALLLVGVCLSHIPAAAQAQSPRVYLPAVWVSYPPTIFGVETALSGITDAQVNAQAQGLGATWLRLNGVLWSAVEPVRGAPYNWTALVELDYALASAKAAGLTPVVIVRGTPSWAAVTNSGCAAVQENYFADYAHFLGALAQRYRSQVSYWEIGNEPDVDPQLIGSDAPFGCWGSINDPYYSGERYGRMLETVAPAIRAANPNAKIVNGGLLLAVPQTTDPNFGRPELFLEGILRAGAANSFDILAYHSYPSYTIPNYDHDLYAGNVWTSLGGWTLGKARYLRETMARYGVSKPLWLNETGLICTPPYAACSPPSTDFYEAQADHAVRILSRAAAANIEQVSWYTLDGPGWRSSGLLDENQNPRPSFEAYQRMSAMVGRYTSVYSVADYGSNIEAYRFVKQGGVVDVVWSRNGATTIVYVPVDVYRSAIIRDGTAPDSSQDSFNVAILVGFRAVFIERAQ